VHLLGESEYDTLGEALLTPTRLYIQSLMGAIKENKGMIKGLANITGGGLLENIPRIVPETLGITLNANSWTLPPLFKWLSNAGSLSAHDMALTLNCGIGMAVICDKENTEELMNILKDAGETVYEIGYITDKGSNPVEIQNTEGAWI